MQQHTPRTDRRTDGRTDGTAAYIIHRSLRNRNANETAHGRSVPPPRSTEINSIAALLSAALTGTAPPRKDVQKGASILRPKALLVVKPASVTASVALSTRPRPPPPVHAVLMAPVIRSTALPEPRFLSVPRGHLAHGPTTRPLIARLPVAWLHSLPSTFPRLVGSHLTSHIPQNHAQKNHGLQRLCCTLPCLPPTSRSPTWPSLQFCVFILIRIGPPSTCAFSNDCSGARPGKGAGHNDSLKR
ncbi:hypothetical protein IWX90DRAFT_157097 [Phyllosticta citrichinensis]|uniref:Uncharacterized protein n=1 Tax=Phyllosticta citrichinensis TaxID=1130410 RepID=A0ABR1XZZ3_9PEZI